MNNVSIIGRTTKDIELKSANGKSYAFFTVAVDGMNGHTQFVPVVAWEKTAVALQKYVHKGERVGITGYIDVSTYQKDGKNVTSVKVTALSADFIEPKKKEAEPVDDFDMPL